MNTSAPITPSDILDHARALVGLPFLGLWERSGWSGERLHFGEKIDFGEKYPNLRARGFTFYGSHILVLDSAALVNHENLRPGDTVAEVESVPELGHALRVRLSDGQAFSVTPLLDPINGVRVAHWSLKTPSGRLAVANLTWDWVPDSPPGENGSRSENLPGPRNCPRAVPVA